MKTSHLVVIVIFGWISIVSAVVTGVALHNVMLAMIERAMQ